MKRQRWFLAAFVVVILSGCNRAQMADLILAVGFHPEWNRRLGDTTEKVPAATLPVAGDRTLEQLVAAMLELQEVRRAEPAGRVDVQRINGILDRIHVASEQLVRLQGLTADERQQVRETELAALNSAVELAPAQFTPPRDTFRRTHFPQGSAEVDNAETSALRILGEYLTAKTIPSGARHALTLHALSYPNCSMNVQLFGTMAERLTNEGQLAPSIQIATDGTKLCAHLPGAKKLQEQVNRIFAEQPAAPGLPFRLSGPAIDRRMVNVAELRGRVVVVTFWATWSPECHEEVSLLRKLRNSYRPEEVEFIGVSLDENRDEFSKYLQDNGVTWPQIFSAEKGQTQWNNPLARYYRVTTIPFTVVIDQQGVIAASGVRGEAGIENAILDQLAR